MLLESICYKVITAVGGFGHLTDGAVEMTQNVANETAKRYEYRTSRRDILLADTID